MDYANASRNETGFTLIEIVITLVLLGIVSAVTIQFVASAAEVGQIQTERNRLVNEARLAMEAMVREIRFAVPASVVATAVSITFDKQFPYLQDPTVVGIDYTYNPVTRVIQRTGAIVSTVATQVAAFAVTDNGGWYTISMTFSHPLADNFSLTSAARPRIP